MGLFPGDTGSNALKVAHFVKLGPLFRTQHAHSSAKKPIASSRTRQSGANWEYNFSKQI